MTRLDKTRAQRVPAEKTSKFRLDESTNTMKTRI
jgi:hypothetical protein